MRFVTATTTPYPIAATTAANAPSLTYNVN